MTYSPRESGQPVLTATRARQARWGRHVFWVLVFGTLLSGLAMFFAWTWHADETTHPTPAEQAATARSANAPAPPTP